MTGSVVLRNLEDKNGTRYLEARIRDGADLIIEGQDIEKVSVGFSVKELMNTNGTTPSRKRIFLY